MTSPIKLWGNRALFLRLGGLIERPELIFVGLEGVALDRQYVGDDAQTVASLDMDKNLDRVRDVALDGTVGQLNTALQNATGEALERLGSGVGVNG